MNLKETFLKEKQTIKSSELTHIEDNIPSPLKEIDDLYGAADALSIKNSQKHEQNLKNVAYLAPAIAFLFLIYDEVEQHWLIVICIILIFILIYAFRSSRSERNHEKYLEYRVLAESLRTQYFLSIAGAKTKVTDIMPWFIKNDVKWVYQILSGLDLSKPVEKRPVVNLWINDQRDYHFSAFQRAVKHKETNDLIERIVLGVTVLTYFITLAFEAYMYLYPVLDAVTAGKIRAGLKISIGTMSAITIFLSNYYGKMSLSSKVEEHRRMGMLFEKTSIQIRNNKYVEREEDIVDLARECLIENTTWYAHQKKNKPDLDVE
ncbi:hypothetical protein [Methanobrevibacter sp.]|uniref:hypothetical protein n=1 Tax=Methanobrevibacter sp. TaxID=66852 RepID=UPI00388F5A15